MQLKFYLNKFLKVDNIEQYTLGALKELENTYEEFKQIIMDWATAKGLNFGQAREHEREENKTWQNRQ